jgi:hypothetical protein
MPHKVFVLERRHVWTVLACFALLTAMYAVGLELIHREGVARSKLRVEQIARVCEAGNATNRALVGYIVAASDPKTLKKISYYREHPDELPDPRVVARRARAAFPVHDCSKLKKLGPTKGVG